MQSICVGKGPVAPDENIFAHGAITRAGHIAQDAVVAEALLSWDVVVWRGVGDAEVREEARITVGYHEIGTGKAAGLVLEQARTLVVRVVRNDDAKGRRLECGLGSGAGGGE